MTKHQTDVVICGAGPVGLLIGLGLAQRGIATIIVEKRERDVQATYGRACSLYPRTIELLEQLGIAEDLIQAAFVSRSSAAFKAGKRVTGRGWHSIFENMSNTFHDYILNIRQSHSEDIFSKEYTTTSGNAINYGCELVDFQVDTAKEDGYNVTATVAIDGGSERKSIRCKYLVGADGGQSYVRKHIGINLDKDYTAYKWIRIDGKMWTDMPDANLGIAAIETPRHGNVLWVKLDRDAYRIGFALTPSLYAKYPNGITKEQALEEAVQAMKPFTLRIERLDWWTNYSINQAVAETFQKDKFVLLAGDAAHVHSSGFAQGMNTGVHDATNLVWKLSGILKGWYDPWVLESYASERRLAALKLIEIDKLGAAAISGDMPEIYRALALTPDEAMTKIMTDNISFNTGLGVSYLTSALSKAPLSGAISAGCRGPDALLHRLGVRVPLRLYDVTRAGDRWTLLVFTGNHLSTRSDIARLREVFVPAASAGSQYSDFLNLATIAGYFTGSAWDAFHGPAIGKLYFDLTAQAHDAYGMSYENGGLALLRPDGILGFAARLDQWPEIAAYVARLEAPY